MQRVNEWEDAGSWGRQNDAFIGPTRGRTVLAERPAESTISMAQSVRLSSRHIEREMRFHPCGFVET